MTTHKDENMPKANLQYKANFLHLSDFHFSRLDEWDSQFVFDRFIEDLEALIEKKGIKIDSILITGDIAFSGHPEEYKLAKEKISEILKVTKVNEELLFIVPGNHDVNRKDIRMAEEDAISSILEGKRKIDEYFRDYNDYKIFLDKFQGYNQFLNDIGNSSSFWEKYSNGDPKPWYSIRKPIGGIQCRIIGLTTSLLSGKENIPCKLYISRHQIQEALSLIKNDEFVIVLSHHPTDWFFQEECNVLKVMMGGKNSVYLHGHSHQYEIVESALSARIRFKSFGAGCAYQGSDKSNRYNVLQVDLDNHKIKQWPRQWVQDGKGWRADNTWPDLTGDYRIINLPKTKIHTTANQLETPKKESNPYWLGNTQLSFRSFPEILNQTKDESGKINIRVVVGSGRYLDSDHVSYGTDCLGVPEVVTSLKNYIPSINVSSCLDIDIYNTENLKNNNLIVIGSGKVNYVTMKLMQQYEGALEFKFTTLYTDIFSSASGKKYRDGEGSDWGLGLVCLMHNPWAASVGRQRIIVLIAGFHPLGSIAANRILCNYIGNPGIASNNMFNDDIPLKIVRGKPIEFNEYLRRISDVIEAPLSTPTYIGSLKEDPQILE